MENGLFSHFLSHLHEHLSCYTASENNPILYNIVFGLGGSFPPPPASAHDLLIIIFKLQYQNPGCDADLGFFGRGVTQNMGFVQKNLISFEAMVSSRVALLPGARGAADPRGKKEI